jgi:hypothetical protein
MGFLTLRSSSMKPLSLILFKPFVLYLGHVHLKKADSGNMEFFKRPIEPYIVEVDIEQEVYDVATR